MSELDLSDPGRYKLIDTYNDNKAIDVHILIEQVNKGRWQKAYAETIAEYIKCGGGKAVEFLAYIIENKDSTNHLLGSQIELSENSGVSLSIVSRTLVLLKKKNLIKQVRNGCYMVYPKLMANGNKIAGAVMLRHWGEL
jgi:hypothetical protein